MRSSAFFLIACNFEIDIAESIAFQEFIFGRILKYFLIKAGGTPLGSSSRITFKERSFEHRLP
ncbi:MAG: hypothetical protein K0Q73_4959 [Paenibacillus sp.]|jgi:hypothetical protein|nr:hypothetical protein [Paenibacillus sp.]